AGQVVDQEGRPVTDAELLLPWMSPGYSGGPQGLLEYSLRVGRSDAAGRFRLDVPVAPYFDHSNLLFATATPGIGWCRFQASTQRREVADLVIRLQPSGDVRVRVEGPDRPA